MYLRINFNMSSLFVLLNDDAISLQTSSCTRITATTAITTRAAAAIAKNKN